MIILVNKTTGEEEHRFPESRFSIAKSYAQNNDLEYVQIKGEVFPEPGKVFSDGEYRELNTKEKISAGELTTDEIKVVKIHELNQHFSTSMNAVKVDVPDPLIQYTPEEIETWQTQEAEAKAFQADAAAPTPMIDAMIAQRGNSKADMVARILAPANQYKTIAGQLLGKRQAIQKQILDSDDPASINVEQLWNQ